MWKPALSRRKRLLVLAGTVSAATAVGLASVAANAYADPLGWSFTEIPADATELTPNGVDALADDDVWTVGRNDSGNAAAHWDGQKWTTTPTPEKMWLYDVSAVETDDAWAVGGGTGDSAYAIHWDGIEWEPAQTPVPAAGDKTPWLIDVDAVASDDVWAVGNTGAVGGGADGVAFFEHWDGTEWSLVEPELPEEISAFSLSAVEATAADDAWAVGAAYTGGSEIPLILHWDGETWTMQPTPDQETGSLTAVTVVDGEVWVSGFRSAGGDQFDAIALLMHRDGDTWKTVTTPEDNSWWYGMVPDNNGGLIMTGYTPGNSAILRYDGATATIEAGPDVKDGMIAGVSAATGSSKIWVVGSIVDEDSVPFAAFTS